MANDSSELVGLAIAGLRQRKPIIWLTTDQELDGIAGGIYATLEGAGARPGDAGDAGLSATLIGPKDYTDEDFEWTFGTDLENLLLDPGYLVFQAPEDGSGKLQDGLWKLLEDLQGTLTRTAQCRAVFVVSANDPPEWLGEERAVIFDSGWTSGLVL